MQPYLKEFYGKLGRYKGSLVRVSTAKKLDKNAKEYLAKLAKQGIIEKAAWGWYYIKPEKEVDVFEFLRQDQNFKALVNQSAASFWNQDFIHRETLTAVVCDKPLKKAMETFARKMGWNLVVEHNKDARKLKVIKIRKLAIEVPDETAVECMRNWAFTDAISVLVANRGSIDWEGLARKSYWTRIPGTNVRVRQAIEYAAHRLNKRKMLKFGARNAVIKNDFVKQELDEALDKVLEFE